MSVKRKDAVVSRRGFLRGVAVAGGAAAASAVVSKTANAGVSAAEGTPKENEQQHKGYRVTPHILDYYEKARF